MNLIQSVNNLDSEKIWNSEKKKHGDEKKTTNESKWWQNKSYQSFAFNENML